MPVFAAGFLTPQKESGAVYIRGVKWTGAVRTIKLDGTKMFTSLIDAVNDANTVAEPSAYLLYGADDGLYSSVNNYDMYLLGMEPNWADNLILPASVSFQCGAGKVYLQNVKMRTNLTWTSTLLTLETCTELRLHKCFIQSINHSGYSIQLGANYVFWRTPTWIRYSHLDVPSDTYYFVFADLGYIDMSRVTWKTGNPITGLYCTGQFYNPDWAEDPEAEYGPDYGDTDDPLIWVQP